MPTFEQYPQASSLDATDAFLIYRPGVGSMYILAENAIPDVIYDVAMGFPGQPPASSTIFVFNAVRAVTLPIALEGSEFSVQSAPSGAVSIGLQKNGTSIGSVAFSNGSTVGTPTFAAAVSFAAGDELRVTTPSALNGMSDLSMTFVFNRTGFNGD